MPGLPFQSKLEPHYGFIVDSRKKRMTWQQIADAIRAKEGPDFTCTRQAVQDFYKRKKRRPYAMGMEPDEPEQRAPSAPPDPTYAAQAAQSHTPQTTTPAAAGPATPVRKAKLSAQEAREKAAKAREEWQRQQAEQAA